MKLLRPKPRNEVRKGVRREAARRSRHAAVAGVCAVAALVAACSPTRGDRPAPDEAKAPPPGNLGQQATLRPIGGSAVTGKIRVVDRGTDDATILVSIVNFPTSAYRIAIHERPNCSSPNGFSAGHAWAPPSSTKPPQDFVPIPYASAESRIEHELRIAGLRATGANGVAGRSVLVYAGRIVTEPRPDVPNDAVACGVFEPVRPLF
jgi:hypothetical protein